MKTTLIMLSLVAALLVFPAMTITHQLYLSNAMMMYVELDRAQIIDRRRHQECFPKEFENDRIAIPTRMLGT